MFYLGTDEFQDRSGFLQALSRYADVRVFTREDGAYGQNDPRPPEIRIPAITARLLALLESHAAEGWTPDVLMGQTWASVIDPDVLSVVRQRWGALIINISMDDRHQFVGPKLKNGQYGGVLPLVPHLDLALTAAPECVRWYESQGCPALYFPEASDPEIFRPMPTQPKVHDVSFVGARYGIREKLVTALRGAGIDVHAYGSGWEGGRLPVDAVPALFAQSRIILGVGTIGHCDDFYALKLRDFDAPMSGSCYLTHDNTDLHGLFDVGREIVTYRNIDDCLEKAKYLLAHEDERESIARAGHARAVGEHTWDLRFAGLFGLLKGLG
ncbi:glycosyltransferase [Denitromonas sp. IR12]|uniref:Glycosyltransferase n=1 Tax=Denitromonas iodatirespirans TaxID=2795389 RepID=A0A944D9J4_DENI1|nr:glycosyltransferase [Denitromonas iodatirespirans]